MLGFGKLGFGSFELGDEIGIAAIPPVAFAQLIERVDQRLGDEHAPVRTEMTALVGKYTDLIVSPAS